MPDYDLAFLRDYPTGRARIVERDDGTRLHCLDIGDGPVVVLAHGYLSRLSGYNIVSRRLVERGYRVVLFDQRGHGRSTLGLDGYGALQMALDYEAVLDELDLRAAVLVGHSMGAFLSVVLCVHRPQTARQRLRGLVLVGGHAGLAAKGSPQNRLQIPLLTSGLLERLLQNQRVAHAFTRGLYGPSVDELFIHHTASEVQQTPMRPTLPILRDMLDLSYHDRVSSIGLPTSVLCGKLDRTCPPWQSEHLASAIPGATMRWLDGVAHMVIHSAPDAIVEEVDKLAEPVDVASASHAVA